MRHRFLATAAATALIAGSACALVFTPPSTKLGGVPSGMYTLDKNHANVIFNLSHMGFSRYFGRFNSMDGTLTFDPQNPEKSELQVTVDIASIDTNNEKLQDELKSAEWFDVPQFPQAKFVSTRIEKITGTTGKVYGDLTIHGVTKPVVLDVTFNGAGPNEIMKVDELGFSANTTIKRSDFGIAQYIPMVGDDVTLTIEAEFHHKK